MADGNIIFSTKIDNSQAEKDLNNVKRKIQKAENDVSKAESAKLPLTKQSEQLGAVLDEAKMKLSSLQKQAASINLAMQPGSNPAAFIDAASKKKQVASDIKAQEKEISKLQKQWDRVNDRIDNYDSKIQSSTAALHQHQAKAGVLAAKLSRGGKPMALMMDKAQKSAADFSKRIVSIGKSALIFSLVYAGLHKAVQYMGSLLKTNEQYRTELARLKGALMTAFQPLYEVALPVILTILRVLTAIVSVAANVFSILTGKSLTQGAKNAKALNQQAKAIGGVGKAAKEARKELAGFDELNIMHSSETSNPGGGGGSAASGITPEFDQFDTDQYKEKIDELTAYLSGALLALGAILAFSGANIPLGIALMAAGAIGLAAVIKDNWGAMPASVKTAITRVMTILGGAALVIGAILTFSGINLPLGIGLMAVGAASLAGAAALNWDTISNALQGPIGTITAIASGALLVLGIILCCSGVALPLGIALIAAGAAGLVTVAAINWDFILEKMQGAWDRVKLWWSRSVQKFLTKEYWMGIFSNITNGIFTMLNDFANGCVNIFRAMGNGIIALLERILSFQIPPISIAGKTIFSGYSQSVSLPRIPYLAQGAVIPPNREFMAVLGDQTNGRNLEAPEDLIRQIVREESGGGGDAEVVSLLREIIDLLSRAGIYVDGRKLAKLITKHQKQMQIAGGY